MEILKKFDSEWADRLGKRAHTFRKAFELYILSNGKTILETGAIRQKDNWEGDGYSTYLWSELARATNSKLYTVDINVETIILCKSITKDNSQYIDYNAMDSIAYLKTFTHTIDLLYLDSFDCKAHGDSHLAQEHQLKELIAALPKLSKEAIVLLDDNKFENGGKTKLTKIKLQQLGFQNIYDEYQSLWVRI